jgi:SAM-dependent methyltransferase
VFFQSTSHAIRGNRIAEATEMQCVVCAGMSERIVWRENGYEGRLCRCGTVYTWPEPPAGAIDPTNDSHSERYYSAYASLKAVWVHRLKPGGRLLEIGCGEGHFLGSAKSLGYEVAGVEPNPREARRVAERLGIEVRCSMLEELVWPHADFDVVYHCDLLSHFSNPVHALRKMAALLAPNGLLAFETGTLGEIQPFWYRWIGKLGYPQHRWLYSEKSLRALLAEAGLEIVRMRHFGLAPAVILYRFRLIVARVRQKLRRTSKGSVRISPGKPTGNHKPSSLETLDQFFRYRVGSVSPRFGPATWLIAARPGQR